MSEIKYDSLAQSIDKGSRQNFIEISLKMAIKCMSIFGNPSLIYLMTCLFVWNPRWGTHKGFEIQFYLQGEIENTK